MRIEIFILTLLLVIVKSSERAYDRIADCESEIEPSTAEIKSKADKISRKFEDNDLLKNDGALGIVGGMSGSPIPLYFAAMAAHRIGISDVRILTSLEVGTALQKMSPELKVYTDTDSTPKLFRRLKSLSVVLLGPGMGPTEYILNNVIKGVVNHCRKNEIPLIVDLDEWFYAPMFISNIGVFPKSGITFLTNRKEFEKLYEGIKKPDGNDSKINVDDTKFGSNIYILRKACKDRGITVDKQLTWLSSELGSAKRSVGQGHLLAGAVGAYYVFASKNNPGVGGMRIAAIATYAASAHVRDCTSRAFIEHQKGMITSDILEQMKRHYKK